MAIRRKRTALDGYIQHNVDVVDAGVNQVVGDCPFCGSEQRFYASKDTGAWDCKRCGRSGSLRAFFEQRAVFNQERFRGSKALSLAKNRGLSTKTLRFWGVGWDGTQYTIPVDACGQTYDLRRYEIDGKMRATTLGNVSLVGRFDKDSDVIWLCEGEWDAMALWEALQALGEPGSVMAVTGGTSFPSHAVPIFQDKKVIVAFDKDETGRKGSSRVNNMLQGIAKTLQFVHWPEALPEKFDVRDLYKKRKKKTVGDLKRLLKPIPPGEYHRAEDTPTLDGVGLDSAIVEKRYRKWLYLPEAEVLTVLFGATLANRFDGDPVWLFFVAPPGGTKSELLMSLAQSPLISTTTSLTPRALISGASLQNNMDPSLIPKLNNKVLVIKDFTTILEMQDTRRDEIFGILRDAYDGEIEWYFGNGIHRKYKSKFGIIGGVTPMIETFGATNSVLGERFLKYRLPHSGHLQSGKLIIRAALNNLTKENKMRDYLQEIAKEVLNREVDNDNPPVITELTMGRIVKLANWVANLRGVVKKEKYTNHVLFKPTQEVGTRIAKQLGKFGMGVAVYLGKDTVDKEVYQVIVSVARSTTPDRVEEIVKHLFLQAREEFVSTKKVASWSRFPEGTVREVLQDLELLRIVNGSKERYDKKWRLSRAMLRLMRPLNLYKSEEAWTSAKVQVSKRTVRKRRRK